MPKRTEYHYKRFDADDDDRINEWLKLMVKDGWTVSNFTTTEVSSPGYSQYHIDNSIFLLQRTVHVPAEPLPVM